MASLVVKPRFEAVMLPAFFERTLKVIIFTGMIATTGLTFFQSIFRYFGDLSFPGANELILLSVVWVYFIGMSYATLKNENIQGGMEDLIKNAPLRKALAIAASFFSSVFAITATYYSAQLLGSSIDNGYVSIYYGLPDYLWVSSVFVGFALTSFFFVKTLISQLSFTGKCHLQAMHLTKI